MSKPKGKRKVWHVTRCGFSVTAGQMRDKPQREGGCVPSGLQCHLEQFQRRGIQESENNEAKRVQGRGGCMVMPAPSSWAEKGEETEGPGGKETDGSCLVFIFRIPDT